MRLLVAEGIDRKWLQSILSSPNVRSQWSKVATGTSNSMRNISQEKVRAVALALPPLKEQRRIVAKVEELLSDLDAGVAALERARANLKRYRAAVLKAAVEGRLTAEWREQHPETEPASNLLECTLTERRKRWEAEQEARFAAAGKTPPKNWREKYAEPTQPDTTGLPGLPHGWCWVRLSQIAMFQNGRPFPSKEYTEEGVKLLRPGNLFDDGSVQWNARNTKRLPIRWAEDHPSHIVQGGEIIMNLTAQSLKDEFLGRTCITSSDECCLLNQRLARGLPPEIWSSGYDSPRQPDSGRERWGSGRSPRRSSVCWPKRTGTWVRG
jgi:type I restriction enzyme S subunit